MARRSATGSATRRFHYYPAEDIGIFWSNDPSTPVGEMLRQLGVAEAGDDIERNRRLQDAAR